VRHIAGLLHQSIYDFSGQDQTVSRLCDVLSGREVNGPGDRTDILTRKNQL
jgi:hypothetical protein